MKNISQFIFGISFVLAANGSPVPSYAQSWTDNIWPYPSVAGTDTKPKKDDAQVKAEDIRIDTALLHKKYIIEDQYTYKEQQRDINWKDIKRTLAFVENLQAAPHAWGVLQNYKNRNGEAPLTYRFARNRYGRVADSLGVERYQSVPLFRMETDQKPTIYGRDGNIVNILSSTEKWYCVENIEDGKRWFLPKRYLRILPDSTVLHHVIFVDRKDQNIVTLERVAKGHWLLRSKNPATTGRNKPPYAQPTPLGIYLVQEQKKKMVYLKDGSRERGGYAPYASRFTNGAYIHGVPVQAPATKMIEYSWSLGTTPRSHMCVRNATSHAKFIYEWAPLRQSLVVVIE